MGCNQSTTAQENTTTPVPSSPVKQCPSDVAAPNIPYEQVETEVEVEEPVVECSEKPKESVPIVEASPVLETNINGGLIIREIGISGYTIEDNGVVMYHVFVVGNGGGKPYSVAKRYNDFKALHKNLLSVMVNGENVTAEQRRSHFQTYPVMPSLPKAGLMSSLRKHNDVLIKERTKCFEDILSAIANHPLARDSSSFSKFLQ